MTPSQSLALLAASTAAGVMNAMAGGGTIVTYPTLLLAGESAIVANATSTVALLPGTVASMAGYRREVAEHRHWLKTLVLPSLLGGTLGAVLLLRTPEQAFARLAPALILFATVLFMVQGAVRRRAGKGAETAAAPAASSTRWLIAGLSQFAVAVYGGYFGAGVGILMLAILGFLGLSNIHAMNGLKNFFGLSINITAAAYFLARGAVAGPAALVMVVGAVAGGYGGARFARHIGQERARGAVVAIGLLMTALLFWQQR
ncbi:MAG TPA: sulfite exporter TauE/SafE family protein [Thermoanaerobaculia bacterium]|nr:sulfite exporter TauE/SafE family protein [Thermoanaerobaculia bacterium]